MHASIGEQVGGLLELSLLRQQSRWKERVEGLRNLVDSLQPNYKGMKGWRMHWDMQARASPPATPATPATPASD